MLSLLAHSMKFSHSNLQSGVALMAGLLVLVPSIPAQHSIY
jgi:hypothetical protein